MASTRRARGWFRAPARLPALRSRARTLRQGLVALALSTAAAFVAGLTLARITGTLAASPGCWS